MKYFSRHAVELSVLFGLLCAVLLSTARFDAACDDLRHNVLRLHIIANSDSDADQAVKIKVRDRILEETSAVFENKTNLSEAEGAVEERLNDFEEIAKSVLCENGFDYGASAELGTDFFETREYESFTLPAGNYRSLIIRLGKAEGKNWWCVVFPAVCVPAASPDARLSDSASEESALIAEHPQKYIMKFKAVEIYEDLKRLLSR